MGFGPDHARAAGHALITMRMHYSNPQTTERGLDPIFYAYLTGAHPGVPVSRQKHVHFHRVAKPSRIDFRIGSTSPTVLELAVRKPTGMSELYGPTNHSELIKLSKIPRSQAAARILLLIDLAPAPITQDALRASYAPLHAGRGRKVRESVTVVYVHGELDYSFCWSPFRSI
ncbi:hypothetical protein R2APBS1_1870 [Rhodanobacter denitrificans]|uniref:Uncharacterized protein n=2 Tax=Rhodanobacter denitrificans TaxID=666685 RepID=M4NE50_9GAMM|nr:hypothetical protein R2APBS1_1870 [Rhodanobacter denitrificans]